MRLTHTRTHLTSAIPGHAWDPKTQGCGSRLSKGTTTTSTRSVRRARDALLWGDVISLHNHDQQPVIESVLAA